MGNKGTQAQIGYAFWTQSIPSPLAWFEPLLSGDKTSRFANTNYSFADSASLNAGSNSGDTAGAAMAAPDSARGSMRRIVS